MRANSLLSVLVMLLTGMPALSAGNLRAPADSERDVWQTIQARRLLAEDPDLSAWNIGVTVQNRVLVLWGPVPSAEVAFRAELAVKTMAGLVTVRNELFVFEPVEAIKPALRIQVPPTYLPDRLPPKLPGGTSRGNTGAPGVLAKQEQPSTATAKSAKQPTATPASVKSSPASESPTLGAPLPFGPLDPDSLLADSVREALHGRPAFQGVQFAIADGRVYVRGANPASVVEAAQIIARLPGVVGVIIAGNEP